MEAYDLYLANGRDGVDGHCVARHVQESERGERVEARSGERLEAIAAQIDPPERCAGRQRVAVDRPQTESREAQGDQATTPMQTAVAQLADGGRSDKMQHLDLGRVSLDEERECLVCQLHEISFPSQYSMYPGPTVSYPRVRLMRAAARDGFR